jgi:cytochrome c-type biogenesis protein CcmF
MNYIGEHLFPGQLGHFLVILSLVASLVATIAYFKSTNAKTLALADSWKKIARAAFLIDAISVISIIATIIAIISNHYYEYHYAWNHSDRSLAAKYLLSSTWEGQEGSFLLWTVWHAILGVIVMFTSRKWEAPVMTVISFAQFCLATMILGVYVFGIKVGSNPFLLTRDVFQENEVFKNANYLSLPAMQDGMGLNQLLQNYWMTIHPPVTFLGFASTIVPFAFAIAGLWTRDFGGWTKRALPWTIFSVAILGTGIMMGAMWAYESLSFGGFWAWDPVENASLVPWLFLVAGLHTQIIYNSTGHSLRATNIFLILGFLFILYSTYLTRSGDLQDTSVHAFVATDMTWQLRAWLVLNGLLAFGLLFARFKKIPHIAKEESTYSREFWMFIGALVLLLSGISIIVPTSFPLINKIIGTKLAIGEDAEFAYNRIQIFVAIVLGILTAVTQYLKYKNTDKKTFWKKILVPTAIAMAASLSISFFGGVNYDKYGLGFLAAIHLAIFAALYTVVANATYIRVGLKGKLSAAGASVAHTGFGLMLLGMLITSANKEILSVNLNNPLNFGAESDIKGTENLTLFQGIRTDMGKYWVTYNGDSVTGKDKMTYFRIDMEDKKTGDRFTLYPDIIKATKGQEGYSANPDSRHYWDKDIFIYVNASSNLAEGRDTAEFRKHSVMVGDTVFYSAGYIILDSVTVNPRNKRYNFKATDTALMANLRIATRDGQTLTAQPAYYIDNNQSKYMLDTLYSQGLALGLTRVVDNRHLELSVKESSRMTPYIALKVVKFPFINLLWLGTVVMIVGMVMSIVRRVKLR